MTAAIGLVILLVALVFGIWLLGFALKLVGMLIVGLIIGGLARLVLPGQESMTLLQTALYGMGGSLAGGLLANVFHLGGVMQLVLSIGSAAGLVTMLGRSGGNTP